MKPPISFYSVVGDSMSPNLKSHQRVVTFNWLRLSKLRVGDIIVALVDSRRVLKRIAKIEKNKVFLLGDNPDESTDSRKYGWVEIKNIIGKVVHIF